MKFKNVYREELAVFVSNNSKWSMDYPPSLSSLQRKALHEVCLLKIIQASAIVVALHRLMHQYPQLR